MEQENGLPGCGSCNHPYGSRGAQGKSVAGDTGRQGPRESWDEGASGCLWTELWGWRVLQRAWLPACVPYSLAGRRRRHAGKRGWGGRGGAASGFSLNIGAQVDDLFLQRSGRSLHTVVERETRVAEAEQGLLELRCLVVWAGNARGFRNAEQHVVERVQMARDTGAGT